MVHLVDFFFVILLIWTCSVQVFGPYLLSFSKIINFFYNIVLFIVCIIGDRLPSFCSLMTDRDITVYSVVFKILSHSMRIIRSEI